MILVLWQVFKFSFFFFIRKQIYCVKNIRSSFVCENCWNPLMVLSLLHGRIRSTFGKKVPDPDPHNWVTCYSTPLTGVSLTGSRISTRQPGLPSSQLPGQLCHCFCLRSVSSMFPLWAPFFNESPVQKSLVLCPLQSELGTRNFSASQRQKGIVSVARLLGWLSQPVWPLSSTVLGREKGNNDNFYIISMPQMS